MRSMKASGAEGLMMFGNRGQFLDPYDPSVLRASMGAQLGLRIVKTNYKELQRWTYRSEIRVLGADAAGRVDYRSVKFRRPVLLMVGDERSGLSPGQSSACDGLVKIPMASGVDSLNVAMAATVLLYEAFGQKHPAKR
jgi:TrmH family RNA methyltransferase